MAAAGAEEPAEQTKTDEDKPEAQEEASAPIDASQVYENWSPPDLKEEEETGRLHEAEVAETRPAEQEEGMKGEGEGPQLVPESRQLEEGEGEGEEVKAVTDDAPTQETQSEEERKKGELTARCRSPYRKLGQM